MASSKNLPVPEIIRFPDYFFFIEGRNIYNIKKIGVCLTDFFVLT